MTKDEIFEKLQTEVTIRGLSPGTYYTYKRAIDLFLNWTNKPYEELEEIDFRNYLLFLINRGDLTTATINMYNAAIRFFLQVILEKDINYRRTARLRKEYKLPPVWSIEEVAKFFSVIDNIRDRAIFINIYGSGLRISEICTLRVQDVDSKNRDAATLVTIGCLYLLFNPHDITANEGCTESRKAAEHDVLLIHSTEKCSYQTRENFKKLALTY